MWRSEGNPEELFLPFHLLWVLGIELMASGLQGKYCTQQPLNPMLLTEYLLTTPAAPALNKEHSSTKGRPHTTLRVFVLRLSGFSANTAFFDYVSA